MSQDQSESDLIRQAAAGDRASLTQLLLGHHDRLKRRISGRITGDLQGLISPEDILHQTFVRAAQRVGSFRMRHEGAFRGWLDTIADNLIKDAAKRRKRERRASSGHAGGAGLGDASAMAAVVEKIAGDCTTPGGRVQRRESIRRLQAALATLPDDQREVLQRYYLQDQSLDQIAEAMGRTRDSIRGVCYRGRKNLRAVMGGSSLYFSG